MKKNIVYFSILFIFLPVLAYAGSLSWTCPECGQTFQFDPRDSAYRDSFAQNHLSACQSSSGNAGGYSGGYTDPSTAVMGNLMNQFFQGYQQGLEQQRIQQQQQQQQQLQQMQEAERIRAEQEAERIRQQQQKQSEFERNKKALLNEMGATGNVGLGFKDISSPATVIDDGAVDLSRAKTFKPRDLSGQMQAISQLQEGFPLHAAGHPIVTADKLWLLDRADLKAYISSLSKEELQKLSQYLGQKETQLSSAIEHLKERETQALLAGYSGGDYQLWTQTVKDKIMDDVPLARAMEALGQKGAGQAVDVNSADFNYKVYTDLEDLNERITGAGGVAEVEMAMAYSKFTGASNYKEGAMAALPYAGEAIRKVMPEPEDLARFGQRTVDIAERGNTVVDAMEEVCDIGYRGMDMHLFNEGIRQNKTANKNLAIEMRSSREYFSARVAGINEQERLISEELRRR